MTQFRSIIFEISSIRVSMRHFEGCVPDTLGGDAASVWLGAFCWKYPLTDISSAENIKKQLQWGAINQFYTGVVNERCRWYSLLGWCSWRTFFYAVLQINGMSHAASCIKKAYLVEKRSSVAGLGKCPVGKYEDGRAGRGSSRWYFEAGGQCWMRAVLESPLLLRLLT